MNFRQVRTASRSVLHGDLSWNLPEDSPVSMDLVEARGHEVASSSAHTDLDEGLVRYGNPPQRTHLASRSVVILFLYRLIDVFHVSYVNFHTWMGIHMAARKFYV